MLFLLIAILVGVFSVFKVNTYFYLLILAIPLGQWTPGSSYHGMHRYSFLRHNCQYNFGAINNSVIKAVYAHMPIRIAMVAMPS